MTQLRPKMLEEPKSCTKRNSLKRAKALRGHCIQSVSSIKRNVKKKVLPRPEAEKILVSRSSPLHCKSAPRFAREVLLLSCLHSCSFHRPVVTTPIES